MYANDMINIKLTEGLVNWKRYLKCQQPFGPGIY